MSQGNLRKDKTGSFSRRRCNRFESPETPRSNSAFVATGQPPAYPPGMAVPNQQAFSYWHSPRCHQPGSHNVGPMHHYPGQQMFLQHGPFGSDGNQYRPVGYLHQFHIRFPSHPEHRHSSYYESRNSRFNYHDPVYFEDPTRSRFDMPMGQDRGFHSEQGAIPKSSRSQYQKGKTKIFRKKKKNHNNSSNVSGSEKGGKSNTKHNNKNSSGERNNHNKVEEPCAKAHTLVSNDCMSEENRESVPNGEKLMAAPHHSAGDVEENKVVSSPGEDLGAIGGEVNHVSSDGTVFEDVPSLSETDRLSASLYDKNLIDEGAICDFDKMFQRQEFSQCNGDNSDDFQSDSDTRLSSGQKRATKRLSARCNGELCKNLSDDESESENCSYVYDPQHKLQCQNRCYEDCGHCLCDPVLSCPSVHSSRRHRMGEDRRRDLVGETGLQSPTSGNHSDDVEDTGDFIDTDLPSHNKHILSSSDEMDNLSSNYSSDHEEDKRSDNYGAIRDPCGHNDLSLGKSKLLNELASLSVSDHVERHEDSSSSQLQNQEDNDRDSVFTEPFSKKKITRKESHSSGSENGDSSPPNSPPPVDAVYNCKSLQCFSSTAPCLDGAAASQLPQETHQQLRENNSCPPGAESALPVSSPTLCFQSNVFCSGAIHRPCQKNNCRQSPGREHFAFTASSVEPSDMCSHPHKPDSASGSTTADGGAFCPPGHQPTSVNDLNACCHHSHSHMANGFSDDSPGANFSNDESNRHQKVFVKFPVEDRVDEGESHSASSCDLEDAEVFGMSSRKQDKSSDSGGSEDPLGHDSGDNVDMVLLPMEEEIEPVHHMGSGPGLCAGGVEDTEEIYSEVPGQLATPGSFQAANMPHLCEEHQYLCAQDHNPLRNGMPSKEFYDLIKTVSTTDSYMRFYDKDGHDVQRQPFVPCDDDASKQTSGSGGQNSKTERLKVDRVMIWNEYEAYVMQFKQIAVSACGQTAVLNVLKALKISCEKLAVCKVIQTSLRKEDACIPEYLFSRARAGTTAEELMSGVEKLSGGTVGGRFFHFWPPRKVKLLQWLAYWMKRGAIPMATLNLQQGPHSLWQVPDSWHHQMVYGVSHQGLYLTNPLEIVSERSAMKQLCSDSVLMVRRQDVFSRFRETTDLGQLLNHPDPRWRTMNVLGQVVNVLREFNMPSVPGYRLQVTSHVSIPASYKAGITLFMRKDKSAWNTLLSAPGLPLEQEQ